MNYEELVKALRCGEYKPECGSSDCPYWSGLGCMEGQLVEDAAAAIEALQAEVKRLKECNDELREKQTFIDNWGTRWMTSAKNVPDSAYKHGYADGKYEALTLERCIDRLHELGWLQEYDRILSQPHWVSVEDELPPPNKTVLVCKIWCDVNGEPHKVITMDSFTISPSDSVIAWMLLPEPPQEVQDGQ